MDLAEVVEFDLSQALANIEAVRPGMTVLAVSSKRGIGMERWLEFLRRSASRAATGLDPNPMRPPSTDELGR
jgi:Ni2+-binding GTPase involved in maturation of urease and hydrogenase